MYKIADFQDYRQPPVVPAPAPGWLHSLTDIIESRYHDEDCIQQLLCLIAEQSGLTNVSVALPDAPGRFKAQFCSTGIRNGVYSFAVQHALCRQSQSREWLVIKEGSERPEVVEPQRDSPGLADRCLLGPVVLRLAVVAARVPRWRALGQWRRHANWIRGGVVHSTSISVGSAFWAVRLPTCWRPRCCRTSKPCMPARTRGNRPTSWTRSRPTSTSAMATKPWPPG